LDLLIGRRLGVHWDEGVTGWSDEQAAQGDELVHPGAELDAVNGPVLAAGAAFEGDKHQLLIAAEILRAIDHQGADLGDLMPDSMAGG
jgi:hypothetical protein